MTLDDLRNLDNDAGAWPLPVKVAAILLLCAAILFAGYWFDTKDQLVTLEQARKVEPQLKKDFEFKQRKAANLEPYKEQLAEMQKTFGALLRQLPNKAEIADLLVDVSQTGLGAGLEFKTFHPTGEVRRGFYAEYRININVQGTFHEFGDFASGIAALPRIVTLHNIVITPVKGGKLQMTAIATTYRYVEGGR